MKTLILYFLILAAWFAGQAYVLHAQPAPAFPPGVWTVGQPDSALVIGQGDASLVSIYDHGLPVFYVEGLPRGEPGQDHPEWLVPYLRPAKAGAITAVVYTQDGRRWRAEWLEVKP